MKTIYNLIFGLTSFAISFSIVSSIFPVIHNMEAIDYAVFTIMTCLLGVVAFFLIYGLVSYTESEYEVQFSGKIVDKVYRPSSSDTSSACLLKVRKDKDSEIVTLYVTDEYFYNEAKVNDPVKFVETTGAMTGNINHSII